MFDDDTFTDSTWRALRPLPRGMGSLGMTWSCNAKANVPYGHFEGDERQRPAVVIGRL